ncbi:MAG: hypothetical protein J6P34_00675 [Paludibacteraceae bacterium]|nr:hypothetical protein [Paludibacteraceae bacterium]
MKIKQLTTLKHKLQWLLLLAALLGMSQGVWGYADPWVCSKTAGGSKGTKYLGDKLNGGTEWIFAFEVNGGWNTAPTVRVGKTTSSYQTATASWKYDSGDNKGVEANIGNIIFNSTGTWYAWGAFTNNSKWAYTTAKDNWGNNSSITLSAGGNWPYWTVNALPNPTSQSSSASGTTATVTWTRNSTYTTVMVVRYSGASPSVTAPTGGTSYSSGSTIGAGTVVYKGTSTTGYSDTGLTAGTTYTYYLYTVNNNYYSSGVSTSVVIPSACTAPTVTTNTTATSIGLQGATVKGTVTDGICAVTETGIVYGTSANPTGNAQVISHTSGTQFSKALSGLSPGTKYYFRAYAKTASGTTYGSDGSFTTTSCSAPSSVTSTQMAAANYCKGATATALEVTGSGGVTPYSYQWYSNTTASNTGGTLIEGATSQSFTPPTSAAGDKYYYCVVKSASPCSSSTRTSSVSGKIHVDATSVAGSITADASSVCNGNGTTLTLGSKTGNVTKWQKSITSSSTGFSDIANTTTSLSTGSLTQNTWYRAVVTNGVCSAATSTAVGVTVVDRPSITTQPASTVVACSGAVPTPNSISVVASGTDLSYQWQLSSTSDEGPWNNLSDRTTDTFTFGVATTGGGTYYYRCKITSATCSDDPIYTTVSTLTVVANPTAGTISGSTEACSGVSGDVSLTLSGHTSSGTGIQWQKSTNSGSTWSNISGATSATLSTSQTVATQYKAVVTTTVASCSRNTSAYSVAMKAPMALTSITLTPNTICTGGESTVTANGLVLSGGSVAYTSSATSKATVAKVSDSEATVSGVAVGNAIITATLSGGCGSTVTKTANITVSEGPAKFTLTAAGGTTICSAGGKLRLSGSESGFSYQLYKNGSAYRSAVEGTGSALEFDVFESGDYVCRAYLTSSPSCYTIMTGEVTLHISLTPTLIPATPTVTSYTPVTITSINTDILTWEISGEGNTAYLYDKTSNTVKVKASAAGSPYTITATTAGGCSQTATLTVNADIEVCN